MQELSDEVGLLWQQDGLEVAHQLLMDGALFRIGHWRHQEDILQREYLA